MSRSWASKLVVAAALAAGALLCGCSWLNRAMLYHPARALPATPERVHIAYADVSLHTGDGQTLDAWWAPLASTSPVVLLCHGNGGSMSHRIAKLQLLRKAGASVLLFDYRGYGLSTGKPSETGTYADGEAAYEWLLSTGVPTSRLILYGESLGNGVSIELAARHPGGFAGLVVDSAFTSTKAMAKRVFPHLPLGWLVRYRYDNLSKIQGVRAPTLVLHSPDDEIIPYAMGRALYDAAPGPKTFVDLAGSHNEGFLQAARAYMKGVHDFLAALPETTAQAH